MDLEPLFGLRLRTPRLELRLASEAQLLALAAVAEAGIHAPDVMPFRVPWTDPSETWLEDFLAFHHALRTSWRPDNWDLELAVYADGQLIGDQGIRATDFAATRAVETGSWLGQSFQGRGYGTEMRTAILTLAFIGLGAVEAHTGAMADNIASQRVSEKLGYERDGEAWPVVRDRPQHELLYRVSRDRFLSSGAHQQVEIVGLEPCLHLFGAGSAATGTAATGG